MAWSVILHEAFDPEYELLPTSVQDSIAAASMLLMEFGPMPGRPHVDTLAGSAHANMKELRFAADDGVWRVAFAFDPERQAILLIAGDKAGVAQKRFYKAMIAKADKRFVSYLKSIKE